MPSPKAQLEQLTIKLTRDGGYFVAEVRVPGLGVQATQGKTVRSALLAAAEVVSLMTEEA